MVTTDFVYIFLNLILLLFFVIAGFRISYDKSNYWEYAFWPIVAFTLILGLRLDRGNDYIHYMQVYLYDLEKKQVLFTCFNHFLKSVGTGPHWIFIWYSGVFILGAMFFLYKIREYAIFVFPLFLIAFITFSEYMIRQAFGYTFVFIFMGFMFDEEMERYKKWACMAVCFWLSYNIHSANAISCLLSFGLYYFVKFPFKPLYSIPLYLLATLYLQKNFDFSYLNGVLSFLGEQSDKFSVYTDNADRWFSKDAMESIYDRKPFIKLLQTIGDCSLMYISYHCLKIKQDKRIQFLYNTFVVGAIITQCFYSLEILRRMGEIMYWFWAFPLAYYLYNKKDKCINTQLINVLSVGLLFYCYEYLKYLFLRVNDMYKFLWDL